MTEILHDDNATRDRGKRRGFKWTESGAHDIFSGGYARRSEITKKLESQLTAHLLKSVFPAGSDRTVGNLDLRYLKYIYEVQINMIFSIHLELNSYLIKSNREKLQRVAELNKTKT